MISTELENVVRIACLVFIIAGLLAAVTFAIHVLYLCRRQGITLLKIEDRALSPASLQTVVLLFATLIGGLWVVYTVAVSGTLELQQLTAERERRNHQPNIKIELQLETLAAGAAMAPDALAPLHIQATIENKGIKEVPLTFIGADGERQPPPLLLVGRIEPGKTSSISKETITVLPYVALDCPPGKDCVSRPWTKAVLEAGGIGYYSFLHPGLAPGLYYVQFQLEVPKQAISNVGTFDKNAFVVWSRAKYFELPMPKGTASTKSESESAPTKN